ncbi:MAG: hypothetical protein QG656_1263 [Candidatus Hydrogenedentes bacterium]|nr:hypothetical protein [Candidatus Hydrogenedentota bacterium]
MTATKKRAILYAGCVLLVVGALWIAARPIPTPGPFPTRAEGPDKDGRIRFYRSAQCEWSKLPAAADDPSSPSPTMTYSAFRTTAIVDPETHVPYDPGSSRLDCNPQDVRHTFTLKKHEFILGEPIVVTYKVWLEGPGVWKEFTRGNYRSRGRDDNFLFLMRDERGEWVQDPQPKRSGMGGGLCDTPSITSLRPFKDTEAVQRWCAIERPGTYDLYCLVMGVSSSMMGDTVDLSEARKTQITPVLPPGHTLDESGGRIIDTATGKTSEKYSIGTDCCWDATHKSEAEASEKPVVSPLIEFMPPELLGFIEQFEKADKRLHEIASTDSNEKYFETMDEAEFLGEKVAHLYDACSCAHFRITIVEGSEQQRKDMVDEYTKLALSEVTGDDYTAYAVQDAMAFSRQTDFLPFFKTHPDLLESCIRIRGLHANPNVDALAMALDMPDSKFTDWTWMQPDDNPRMIDNAISLLTHDSATVRLRALCLLERWGGEHFGVVPVTSEKSTVSAERGTAEQSLWRAWWAQHKNHFKARDETPKCRRRPIGASKASSG